MTRLLPLAKMAELTNGYPFDSDDFSDAGLTPLVRIRDLTASKFTTYLDRAVADRWCIQNHDVVIGMDGDFNVVRWSRGHAALNQRLCRLRPKIGADLRFVAYQLPSHLRRIRATQYVTTVAHISSGEINALRLSAPPLDEQRRIADFLDHQVARLDAAAAAAEEAGMLAARASQARMDLLFDGSGEPVPLKSLLRQFPQYGVLVPELMDTGVPFVRIKDLSALAGGDTAGLAAITAAQSREYRRTVVTPGDVLIGVVGSTDKAAVVPEHLAGANIARAVARLVPKPAVPSEVLMGWLTTTAYKREVAAFTDADTAQPTLNMGDLRLFRLPLPDMPLTAVAELVLATQAAQRSVAGQIRSLVCLLQERKRALITACVTGEFDVSSASDRAVLGL